MHRLIILYALLISSANILTNEFPAAFSAVKTATLQVPPCGAGTKRAFIPDESSPLWTGCLDEKGLFQGILIQLSGQTEILRVAGVKDSERDGREIRAGALGYLEERNFKNGHLNGKSFIFKTTSRLGQVFPPKATAADWKNFTESTPDSALKVWLKQEPETTLEFTDGRLSRMQFEKTDYQFRVSKDGRMFALNHPEMKDLFFIDTEPLWSLDGSDLKAALLPGFGSCKKYSGPIGRFGRNYDHLIFRRESSEKKHLDALKEMRDRFIAFCVPEDIRTHLGKLECPPQLPTPFSPQYCLIPVSDRLHIPYEPKYFNYEFTLGRTPDELHEILKEKGLPKFASTYSSTEEIVPLTDLVSVQIRRTSSGMIFRPLVKEKDGRIKMKKETGGELNKDWADWQRVPGF